MTGSSGDSCVFCEIITEKRNATVLLESNRYLCILDKYPVNEGHALVFPKEHIQCLQESDWECLNSFLKDAFEEVRERYQPDAVNIGINDGPEAGQTVPHLHWHIIPRYEGDVSDPTGGVRGVIPERRTYD